MAANKGAPGVDKESLQIYKRNLGGNLYKLWNRMSSGSYHPLPVRQVLIPKGDGFRSLGIPTVADRTAQMAVKMVIEPRLEQIFHPGSYGYRPGRGAKDAVTQVRQNCWRYDWVLDMDIKAFFDIDVDNKLTLSVYNGRDDLNYNFNSEEEDAPTLHYDWGNTTGSLSWTHVFNPRITLSHL